MNPKTIWLPKAETSVRIRNGEISIEENMRMEPRPVATPTGFRHLPAVVPSPSVRVRDGS